MQALIPLLYGIGSVLLLTVYPTASVSWFAAIAFLGGSVVSIAVYFIPLCINPPKRRTLYRFIIGAPRPHFHGDKQRAIESILIRHFGGYTFTQGFGGWNPSATDGAEGYGPGYTIEQTLIYSAVSMLGGSDIDMVKRELAPYAYAMGCRWIQVESHPATVEHFDTLLSLISEPEA